MPPLLSENRILIQAPASRVAGFVSLPENWMDLPDPLRAVFLIEKNPAQSIMEVRAWARQPGNRWGIACQWIWIFRYDAGARVLRCDYLEPAWRRGLRAEWHFEETALGTQVTVRHARRGPILFWRQFWDRRLLAPWFIEPVTAALLLSFKVRMEAS